MIKLNLSRIKAVFLEFPLVIFSALLLFLFIYAEIDSLTNYDSVGIIFSSAIPLFFGLKMLSQSIGKIWILRLVGLLLLVVYYFVLPTSKDEFTEITVLIVMPVYVFLHLFVAVAKNLSRKEKQETFWHYNINLFTNICTSLIFTAVLTAGILSVIYTCDELFELNIDGDSYMKVFAFITTIGNTLIFLLFVYKDEFETKKQIEFPLVIKFFTQFVLIPIMILYTLVLYIYSIKILISWELPQGWLSYGILSYSMVGILALLLVYPLRKETKKSWVKWFYNLFFYSLIPLIVLLYVAIYTRLFDYGFTEARYYVLALTVWLSIITLYFIFYKKASISFIPISLMIVIVFALIFPYFNAFTTSIRSQQYRVERILVENNLLKDGLINFNSPVKSKVLNQINSKFRFLEERGATQELIKFLDDDRKKIFVENKPYYFLNPNDFTSVENNDIEEVKENSYFFIKAKNNSLQIKEEAYIWTPERYNDSTLTLGEDQFMINNTREDLKIVLNDKETFDIFPEIKTYIEEVRKTKLNVTFSSQVETDDLLFQGHLGKYELNVYLDNIQVYNFNENNFQLKYIIIKERK